MRMAFWGLAVLAICVLSAQSQMSSTVSDAEMSAISEPGRPKDPHIFEREANSSICVNQTYQSPARNITYYIFIKNTGDMKLTNVTVEDILPDGVVYIKSNYFDPVDKNLTLTDIVRERDDTTKILRWHLWDLQTGQEKKILLSVRPVNDLVQVDAEKNVVTVRAEALGEPEIGLFEDAAMNVLAIHTNYTMAINGNVTTYRILVKNDNKTRLKDVVLDDTLPANKCYLESKCFNESGGQVSFSDPTVINNIDGTTKSLSWFLGDFETSAQKTVELNVSCRDCNCLIQGNKVEASGWASIVNKIPIWVNDTYDDGESEVTSTALSGVESPTVVSTL